MTQPGRRGTGKLRLGGENCRATAGGKVAGDRQVHTTWRFSPTALYSDMRSAWNPAMKVVWRRIEENLFTVQFSCLADWNKAMFLGP